MKEITESRIGYTDRDTLIDAIAEMCERMIRLSAFGRDTSRYDLLIDTTLQVLWLSDYAEWHASYSDTHSLAWCARGYVSYGDMCDASSDDISDYIDGVVRDHLPDLIDRAEAAAELLDLL